MTTKDIRDAWARIRKIDNSIPDDVLDFMKDAAIEKIERGNSECKHSWHKSVASKHVLYCGLCGKTKFEGQ